MPDATLALFAATRGASTPVWQVEAVWPDGRKETLYLRLGEEPSERRDGEVRLHQLLHAANVRVPEVVVWEGMPPELDRAATLTRAIPGIPLKDVAPTASPAMMAKIARTAGEDLARIGAIPVDGFGWIDMPDATTGTLRAEHTTRGTWLAEYDATLEEIVAANLLRADCITPLREAFALWRASFPDAAITATLAHGDFDATHIFCAQREVPIPIAGSPYTYTGIIDFGEARGADPFYDLGHALLHDGEDGASLIFPALLAGYRSVHPVANDDLDAIRTQAVAIAIRHLAIAHRRSSPYSAVLAARITELLETRLDDDGSEIHP
ncbi:MAG: phosphotransferase [Thermomicrobiales bacterium]